MFHSRWIHKLLSPPRSRSLRRRQAAQTRKPVRLILESLEERVTPTQTAGSYTELVNAIAADTAANTNYLIDITNSFTFNAGGQVTISKLGSGSTLTIQSQDGANYTLTGNGNRLFDITASQNVTLNNLALTGGSGVTEGGAILDSGGTVNLRGDTVKTNTATGTATAMARGGGVFVSGGGSLSLVNTLITNNSAKGVAGTTDTPTGGVAQGGGLYVNGASTVTITISALSNNKAAGGTGAAATLAGASGGDGGSASGGGLYVNGSSWTVTLKGDTLSGNTAVGGAGGAGATGATAVTTDDPGGAGGAGGAGGDAAGGGLFASGSGTLTILNDLAAPMTYPSIMIGNSATGGAGGTGGTGGGGGTSGTGGTGGGGGTAGTAAGGAVALSNTAGGNDVPGAPLTANIGNTTFYGNTATGGTGGTGGAGGTGGNGGVSDPAGTAGTDQVGGSAAGGGVSLSLAGTGGVTMVNNTVATNTATGGAGGGTAASGSATGGGIFEGDATLDTFDNNTITLNTVAGTTNVGGGIAIESSNPTLINNLIQGNTAAMGADLDSGGTTPTPLTHATNNFITVVFPANAVDTTTNIVGNTTPQLGAVVGIAVGNNTTGGPIYYPLLSGTVSIGAGTTSVLSTILNVERTNLPTDEVGQLRTTNGTVTGSISLGAVQPLQTGAPLATTVVPGDVGVNDFDSNPSPAFTITAAVNATSGGTASGSALSIYLNSDDNNPPTLLGTAVVAANGIATVSVPAGRLPADLQPGTYDLIENFSGNPSFDANNAIGKLTIIAPTSSSGPTTPTPASTAVIPGNAVVSTNDGTLIIPVVVNSPSGTVTTGTVTISLVNGNTTTVIGSAAVSGGSANVSVNIPTLTAGTYQLIETFSDSTGAFGGSSALGTLIAQPLPPQVAALELAIDAAALVSMNNPGALAELSLFAETFLHYQIPMSIPALIGSIQALFTKAEGLGLAAIGAGMFLANDLAIENPI